MQVSEREVGSLEPGRLVTSRVVHEPYPHKTTERAQFYRAVAEAGTAGADDALLLAEGGWVAETAIWGIYWWEGKRCARRPGARDTDQRGARADR